MTRLKQTRRVPRSSPQEPSEEVIVLEREWDFGEGHFSPGDPIVISGAKGPFTFVSHDRHLNGNEWVAVLSSRGYRHFATDRVQSPKVIKRGAQPVSGVAPLCYEHPWYTGQRRTNRDCSRCHEGYDYRKGQ